MNRTARNAAKAVLGLGAVAAALSLLALRRFRLPTPTGRYAVGTRILNLTDNGRHEDNSFDPSARRELVVQLWYPASPSSSRLAPYQRWSEATLDSFYTPLVRTNSHLDAPFAPGGPFPVLLFGHRWNGTRTQNTALAEDLASHGYVVVSIDHPYNSARVELSDGRVIHGTLRLEGADGKASAQQQIATWNRELKVWAADDLFVLDQLTARDNDPRNPLHGALDTAHVGAFGHSFGGAVALYLCGLDPRIVSGVNLDGWVFGGLANRTTQPVMMLYERAALDRNRQLLTLPSPGSTEDQMDRADNATVNADLAQHRGERYYIAGAQHMDFADQPLLPPLHRGAFTGPISPMRIRQIVSESVRDFFDQTLRGQGAVAMQRYPEVTVETAQPSTAR